MQRAKFPAAFEFLFQPARYKIIRGGRGSAKSESVGRALLIEAANTRQRVLCMRELQNSIADSSHKLLCDAIADLNLGYYFTVQNNNIYSTAGSEFLFKGLRHNATEIKSTKGVTRGWVDEAQKMSYDSLKMLRPTIRDPGSELCFTFNPDEDSDPIYQFALDPPAGAVSKLINFDQNPFFPAELEAERQDALRLIAEAKSDKDRQHCQAEYDNIWLGMPKRRSDAAVLKRWRVAEFETPPDARFFHGLDFGFAQDPTAATRSFVRDNVLYVDQEAGGAGIEIDDTPAMLDSIPTARDWPIKADNARPETISYLLRRGFNITAAEKWPGSVEDGIAHLNGFKEIVIHPRCPNTAREARLYSYKVDRITGDILPVLVDAENHYIDAIRYSLDGYILRRGGVGVWERLAK